MNKVIVFLTLLIFVGSLSAFIGEGVSNIFSITGTPVDDSILPPTPQTTCILSVGPNPFRSGAQTQIDMNVKAGETAICGIYNLAGQLVKSQSYTPGYHRVVWDGRDSQGKLCGSGIYLVRLKSASHISSAKLVLLK